MNGDNKSSLEKYAEIKLKQEKLKIFNDSIKSICILSILVLVIIGLIYNWISGMFVNEATIKDCFNSSFKSTKVNESEKVFINNDGIYTVGVFSRSTTEAIEELRDTYHKISDKIYSDKITTLSVFVGDSTTEYGDFLISSNIDIKDIKSIEWSSIKTYDDFIKAANINIFK